MTMPVRAMKRPVEVEAMLLTGNRDSQTEVIRWVLRFGGIAAMDQEGSVLIHTLEGSMTANPGDFVIKGVNGEFYPCKPDIFHKTYDIVGVSPDGTG